MSNKYVVFAVVSPSNAPSSKASVGTEDNIVCPCCLKGKVDIKFIRNEAVTACCNDCNTNLVVVDCI